MVAAKGLPGPPPSRQQSIGGRSWQPRRLGGCLAPCRWRCLAGLCPCATGRPRTRPKSPGEAITRMIIDPDHRASCPRNITRSERLAPNHLFLWAAGWCGLKAQVPLARMRPGDVQRCRGRQATTTTGDRSPRWSSWVDEVARRAHPPTQAAAAVAVRDGWSSHFGQEDIGCPVGVAVDQVRGPRFVGDPPAGGADGRYR